MKIEEWTLDSFKKITLNSGEPTLHFKIQHTGDTECKTVKKGEQMVETLKKR